MYKNFHVVMNICNSLRTVSCQRVIRIFFFRQKKKDENRETGLAIFDRD